MRKQPRGRMKKTRRKGGEWLSEEFGLHCSDVARAVAHKNAGGLPRN